MWLVVTATGQHKPKGRGLQRSREDKERSWEPADTRDGPSVLRDRSRAAGAGAREELQ